MVINESGQFWWDGEDENKPVSGHLQIDERGYIQLKMHGPLGVHEPQIVNLASTSLSPDIRIRGILSNSKWFVLLEGLRLSLNELRLATGFLSFKYDAERCLHSRSPVDIDMLNGIRLPLQGLDEWFRPGTVHVSHRDDRSMKLILEATPAYCWDLDGARLSLISEIDQGGYAATTEKTVQQFSARFEMIYEQTTSAHNMLCWIKRFEEFISLLDGAHYTFPWPQLMCSDEEQTYLVVCYSRRERSPESKAFPLRSRLAFDEIRERFGSLLEAWMERRQELGPGFHLYTGTLRNPKQYLENLFISLVWGLEALSRHKQFSIISKRHRRKVETAQIILNAMPCAESNTGAGLNRAQRTLLVDALNTKTEIPLEERLYVMLLPVSPGIEFDLLIKFCRNCAKRRNDLSHRGGSTGTSGYDEFINAILPMQKVLEVFYRLVILEMIGVSHAEIRESLNQNSGVHELRFRLEKAGLLAKDGPASSDAGSPDG